jgi:hypothetical protein
VQVLINKANSQSGKAKSVATVSFSERIYLRLMLTRRAGSICRRFEASIL